MSLIVGLENELEQWNGPWNGLWNGLWNIAEEPFHPLAFLSLPNAVGPQRSLLYCSKGYFMAMHGLKLIKYVCDL